MFYICKDNGAGFDEIREDTIWETVTPSCQQMNEETSGGQVLPVAPEFDLIVVTNRKYRVEGETNLNSVDEFFNEHLPAVLDSFIT